MNSFFYWLAETVRPLYGHEPGGSRFHRQGMLREASLSANWNMRFGVFDLLGIEAARRAAKAWRPREIYFMEDISLAFDRIEERRLKGVIIDPSDLEWLINVVSQYFQYLKLPVSKADVRELVEGYLAKNSVADPVAEFEDVEVDHPLLERLCEVDREIEDLISSEYGKAGLHHIGLFATTELDGARYAHCTPNNVRTFASTGGEGCHFSFLVQDGRITVASPVVVTAPGVEGGSAIVGENLYDFLCLGCERGYGSIEWLTDSNPERQSSQVARFINADGANPDDEPIPIDEPWVATSRQILRHLRSQLDLKPWTSADHFHELQEQYLHLLRYPPGRS